MHKTHSLLAGAIAVALASARCGSSKMSTGDGATGGGAGGGNGAVDASADRASASGGFGGSGSSVPDGGLDGPGPDLGGAGIDAGPCTVASDGGALACTTTVAASYEYDFFCGLKADGQVRCWGSADASYFVTQLLPTVAAAPAHLVQLAVIDSIPTDPAFCGVDEQGLGTCWGRSGGASSVGQGLRAVTLSRYGACGLGEDGTVTCRSPTTIAPPPETTLYTQLVSSEDVLGALDEIGTPVYPGASFPDGIYTEIAANIQRRVGAVRIDGAVVTVAQGGAAVVKTGSFTHLALDGMGRACALGSDGGITCWLTSGAADVPFANLPAGPFIQITGANRTFCAVRPTGTTACWGDVTVDVPAAW